MRGKVNRTWAMPSGTTSSTFLVTTLGIEKALGVQSQGWPVSSGSTMTAKEKLRERIETFTEEEAAVQVARKEIARGETISLEEIRAEFDAQR